MIPTRNLFIIYLLLAVITLAGCDNRTRVGESYQKDWAKRLNLPKANFTPDPRLELVTWHEYLPQEVFDLFTRTYGTQIVTTLVNSNEEIFELLEKNPGKYDLATPSDYMVTKMIGHNLLHRLEPKHLPNMENLNEDVRRAEYDRGLRYCVPLFRNSMGISFNISYIGGIPRNWDFVARHFRNDYLAYRVGITKEMRFALGVSLMFLGYSPNTTKPEEIIAARELLVYLVEHNGLVLMGAVNDDKILINNDILLGVVWNGTAASAQLKNPNIRFILPEGKVLVTIDNAVISAQSQRTRTAELFANFLLTPQVAARMSNYNFFPNCVTNSLYYIRRSIRNGPGFLFPDEEDRLFLKDVGESTKLYEEAWAGVLQAKTPESLIKLPLPRNGFFEGDAHASDPSKKFIKDMQGMKKEGP